MAQKSISKIINSINKQAIQNYEYCKNIIDKSNIDDLAFINSSKLFYNFADPKFNINDIYDVYNKYIFNLICFELYFAEIEEYEKAAIIKKAYELETEMVCNFLPEINVYKYLFTIIRDELFKSIDLSLEEEEEGEE